MVDNIDIRCYAMGMKYRYSISAGRRGGNGTGEISDPDGADVL
jgi:hypothetical protein